MRLISLGGVVAARVIGPRKPASSTHPPWRPQETLAGGSLLRFLHLAYRAGPTEKETAMGKWSRAELEDKFRRLVQFSAARSDDEAGALIDTVWRLRELQRLDALA